MACATAARLPFSFRPRTPQRQSNSKPTTTHIPTRLAAPKPLTNHFVPSSVDVSKEDKPMEPNQAPAVAEEEEEVGQEGEFDKRRLDENFAVLNTGIYECRSCGYKYDKATGDPTYPIPAGLDFEKLPEDWRCPTCGAAKSFFVSKRVEIAGFAQNQQFGFGGNTLTSGQKAVLIYGSLLLFFALFLSGYFLQ